MEKIPFNISASAQGQTAFIRITGTIGWDTDCELYRARIDAIAKQGLTDAHIYLNGPGGSVFDAEEIVNITKSVFKGRVTGEGGSLVASAYTRIAAMCDDFEMPENGMYMIHKPAGYTGGTVAKIESYLKLLRNIETQYFDLYNIKAIDKAELAKQWEAGDWWMTAKEALANGFITSVKAKTKIDAQTTALISACGCPPSKIPQNNHKIKDEMDLKTMAQGLGLPESASEAEVNAAIEKGKTAQADLVALKQANAEKEKRENLAKITATLDKAIESKKITADTRKYWEGILTADLENGTNAIEALEPITKLQFTPPKSSVNSKTTHQGKTFAELQDEDPDALAELEANDPEAFAALFAASYTTKK